MVEDELSDGHRFKVVSLFSGAMGLDLGLEATGRFEILACVEKDPVFCETIRRNQAAGRLPKDLIVFEKDIRDLDPEAVLRAIGLKSGEVDLIVGGPPCQSFSTAGKRGTTQDPRGTLLWQFLQFVEAMGPRFFLMENVRGLLSAALKHRPIAERPKNGGPPLDPEEEPGSVVRLFAEGLQKLSEQPYHMDCFEVNSVNYGVPQIRERALFIGNRFNDEVDFPDPTHHPPGPGNDTQLVLPDVNSERQEWRTLGDAICGLMDPAPVILDFSPRKKKYLRMVKPGSNWRSLPEKVQKESMGRAWGAKGGRSGWWRRLTYDLPCPTLTTMPNHASTSLCHPEEIRALTLREYAAVQEFPKDWEFSGTASERYAQVGNAVPIRLGTIAGEVIAERLSCLERRGWRAYAERPEAYRVVYVQAHVRTRRWYKDGETFVRKSGGDGDGTAYRSPKTQRKTSTLITTA